MRGIAAVPELPHASKGEAWGTRVCVGVRGERRRGSLTRGPVTRRAVVSRESESGGEGGVKAKDGARVWRCDVKAREVLLCQIGRLQLEDSRERRRERYGASRRLFSEPFQAGLSCAAPLALVGRWRGGCATVFSRMETLGDR